MDKLIKTTKHFTYILQELRTKQTVSVRKENQIGHTYMVTLPCKTQQAILTQSLLQQAVALCYQRFRNSTASTIKQNVLFVNAADVPGTKRTLIKTFHF